MATSSDRALCLQIVDEYRRREEEFRYMSPHDAMIAIVNPARTRGVKVPCAVMAHAKSEIADLQEARRAAFEAAKRGGLL